MKRIPIAEATATQLADFANTNLGLADVQFRMGADRIRSQMATVGYDKDYIEVAEETPRAAAAAAPDASKPKTYTIIIPNQNEPGGKDAVPVGVNGKVYLIKRGVEVDVPAEVVEVLRNAQKVQYDSGPNGEPINPTFVPTHTYSILAVN